MHPCVSSTLVHMHCWMHKKDEAGCIRRMNNSPHIGVSKELEPT